MAPVGFELPISAGERPYTARALGPAVWLLEYLINELPVPAKPGTVVSINIVSCNSLLNVLLACIIYRRVRASWIELYNFPTKCELFSLLRYCRQLYMFRV